MPGPRRLDEWFVEGSSVDLELFSPSLGDRRDRLLIVGVKHELRIGIREPEPTRSLGSFRPVRDHAGDPEGILRRHRRVSCGLAPDLRSGSGMSGSERASPSISCVGCESTMIVEPGRVVRRLGRCPYTIRKRSHAGAPVSWQISPKERPSFRRRRQAETLAARSSDAKRSTPSTSTTGTMASILVAGGDTTSCRATQAWEKCDEDYKRTVMAVTASNPSQGAKWTTTVHRSLPRDRCGYPGG